MRPTAQLLGAVSAFALVAMSSAPAIAAGTSAGVDITNTVTVQYQVGGVQQNDETDSDTFTVDRRVNVTVAFTGAGNTSVTPGEENAVLAFDVTNLSNDEVDLDLTTALTGGTGANIGSFEIYLDSNDNGVLDAAELTAGAITTLDDVAEDETVAVLVVADIGLDAVNGDLFDVVLTADATDDSGNPLVDTAGANTSGIDTVLFDGAGETDAANDGAFSALGTYEVAGALVTVAKSSSVVSDPVNGTTNPKAIPGATIEYCITVANAAGGATATDVDVIDDLPADVSYVTGSTFVDGDANCENGTSGGAFSAGTGPGGLDQVTGSLSDIAAGGTRSLYFRVTIN
ncbi:conserved repeat domain-containing protein [Erythrobacter litoralis]|uniref:Uncharacterized protein n=1 Tax=Erythrobacter litoralis TaxID=39960 RepID=A0A074MZ54_9SPHN|nr:DUF11 domain-containing protein [Erythrobacter litoralis]AOL23813.1 conserved repeat domain-containing protein [Erythrobacter litoralis]KEO98704.1 hypothetical protein EH32_06250 [Erythrobacter litoralis]MEE4339359.1 DUF11 domain-containing protein [Erythrobacter sp.]